MEFGSAAKRKRGQATAGNLGVDRFSGMAGFKAIDGDFFYRDPPSDAQVSLIELEELAIARLKLLKDVEAARDIHGKNQKVFLEALSKLHLQKNEPTSTAQCQIAILPRSSEECKNDKISHFILRLAFCRSPDAQKWFLQQELELFKYRLYEMPSDLIINIVHSADSNLQKINFNPFDKQQEKQRKQNEIYSPGDLIVQIHVSQAEKEELHEKLEGAMNRSTNMHMTSAVFVSTQEYWKIDFLEAIDLVGQRRVFLKEGIAYVPKQDINVILAGKFRAVLSFCLAYASKHYGALSDEERLMPILRRMNNRAYLGKDYNKTGDENVVTPGQIDSLSESSFPLCMRSIHQHLRRNHHLRHGARMQYGLFLKGIGLTLEGAMAFFRDEFTKNMDMDKFEKQYAYNIRHNYGKEGKRANYTPLHCGCPFKHWDSSHLSEQLQKMNIATDRAKQIVQLAKESRYDKACTRVFEATHGLPGDSMDQLITHPNQYFDLSKKQRAGGKIKQRVLDDTITARSYTASQSTNESQASSMDVDITDEDLSQMI